MTTRFGVSKTKGWDRANWMLLSRYSATVGLRDGATVVIPREAWVDLYDYRDGDGPEVCFGTGTVHGGFRVKDVATVDVSEA